MKSNKFAHIIPIAILLFLISGFILSCNQTEKSNKEASETSKEKQDRSSVHIDVEERSPEISGAKVTITSPGQGSILQKDKDVYVSLKVRNFEMGAQTDTARAGEIANSDKGQHVHVIVDNQPYMAFYEDGKSVDIGKLDPGPHSIIAFPSRSYHESVKSSGASNVLNFYVGEGSGEFRLTGDTPSIIYSRPKGEYKGKDIKKVMLDFYLNNVELSSDGYKARYTITSKNSDDKYSITMTEWKPAFIYNLPPGEYTVKLELIDKDGNPVPGGYNTTERDISVANE